MAKLRSALARINTRAHGVLVAALLGASGILSGCASPLPKDAPDAVRRYVSLPHAEQYRTLDQYPPAIRVELVCAAWRHKRPENASLVHALAGSGCAVLPSIRKALDHERNSDLAAKWLIDALGEMDLRSCDSLEVRNVIRTASARIARITDSYDRLETQKSLAVAERMVSH